MTDVGDVAPHVPARRGGRWRLITAIAIGSLIGAFWITVASTLIWDVWDSPDRRLDKVVPAAWEMKSSSGDIAELCFGGWSECGTIEREYSTGVTAIQALEQLRAHTERRHWVFETSPVPNRDSELSATVTSDSQHWDAIASFSFKDQSVSVDYNEQ